MKTHEDIDEDLRRLLEGHYYSEDYELEWAAKYYYEGLAPVERERFEGVMVRRLTGNPGLADLALCARLALPSLTPLLAGLLDKETSSTASSRAILTALSNQPDQKAFDSVERFMESEQEGEALVCLARMNFERALPHLRWAMQKDHLHNFCIHALHEYMKASGMENLLTGVRALVAPDNDRLAPHLRKILMSKKGRFNPFTDDELAHILATLT